MSTVKLQKVNYSEDKKELSYEFTQGKLYSIHYNSSSSDDLQSLFQVMAYFKLPPRGDIFWGDVNIRKLNPTTYRSNMITIITEENTLLKDMRVVDYLKYVTNNFGNTYTGNIEFMDYLELVYSLLQEFGFNEKGMKTRIKKLDSKEKWQLKIVESLLKGSDVLLINKTLDFYDNEFLDFCIDSLQRIVDNYNHFVIIFTEKEEVSNKVDYLINI